MCTGRLFIEEPKESCGRPECPVLAPGESAFFSMYAPSSDEKGVSYYRFGLVPRLDAGVGYSWTDSRMLASVNYLVKAEDAGRPAWMLGIGSRRTGGSDSSAFLSASKSARLGRKALRFNVGMAYTLKQAMEEHAEMHHHEPMDPMDPMDPMPMTDGSSQDTRKAFIIGGAAVALGRSTAGALQYDGRAVHALLTGRAGGVNLGVMFLRMRDAAFSMSYSVSQ